MSHRTALITGAAKRVGAAIARELHSAGLQVVIHYHHSAAAANALAAELNDKRPESAWLLQADLADSQALPDVVDSAITCNGRLDVLINNASVFYPTPLEAIDDDSWSDMMNVNLRAPLLLARHAAAQLRANQGCIINLTDIHGERPLSEHTLYSTSKAGLIMLTKALAKEMAPDVRVNAVSPGAVLWPRTMTAETQQAILSRIALNRRGNPEDVARAVLFLIRDAGYVTGQVLSVDGGRLLSQ